MQNTIPNTKTFKGMSTVNTKKNEWGLYDIALIKQNLINHFHIRQGENLNDPRFGTIIWDLIYEHMTAQIKQLIINDVTRIVNHDPRTKVDAIRVDAKEHGYSVECDLTYIPYNIKETVNFMFNQQSMP